MDKQTLSQFSWTVIAILILGAFIIFGPNIARFLGNEILDVFPQLFLEEENEAQIQEDCVEFKSFFPFTLKVPSKGWDGTMQYYNGEEWVELPEGSEIKPLKSGYWYYICIRGKGNKRVTKPYDESTWTYYPWVLDGTDIYCSGNIETLLDYEKVQKGEVVTMDAKCYAGLFQNCKDLISAPYLPAKELTDSCYRSMFNGCKKLKMAPKISADTVGNHSCDYMFANCKKLVVAPELPATVVGNSAYYYMFAYCTSLKAAPTELPATSLGTDCYRAMFMDCTALKTAPDELPAETLASRCYQYMFEGCTKLKNAPKLMATKLAEQCCMAMFRRCKSLEDLPTDMLPAERLYQKIDGTIYNGTQCYARMFEGCTSLETAPNLPADQYMSYAAYSYMFKDCTSLKNVQTSLDSWYLTQLCYKGMFENCTSLETAPVIKATTLREESCMNMFSGCTSLKNVYAMKFEHLSNMSCANMFFGCTSLKNVPLDMLSTTESLITTAKDIEENENVYKGVSCYANMFRNCTNLREAPNLPAVELAESCYTGMFNGCTKLTQAPNLPAKTLTSSCYRGMFDGCVSLVNAPKIDATGFVSHTQTSNSCDYMFANCTSLKTAPKLHAEILAPSCYFYMFYNCTSLTQAPDLPALSLAHACYDGMFKGCTSLTETPALPATIMPTYCYCEMFSGCKNLVTIPKLPAGEVQKGAYKNMFYGCTGIKLSETKTEEYTQPYRLPADNSEEQTNKDNGSLYQMFEGTGGPWKGTPTKKEYYLLGTIEIKVQYTGYLEFISTESFTLGLQRVKGWNGTIQYKTTEDVNTDWQTWDGSRSITAGLNSSGSYIIRLRGKDNVVVSGHVKVDGIDQGGRGWTLTGTADIECNGNIESLLDYEMVQKGEESPAMGYGCFWDLFKNCDKLVKGPELPATTLVDSCYRSMFEGCTGLKVAPVLPAMTTVHRCYMYMFAGCTSLKDAPDLPATNAANTCYSHMFYDCTSLETVPELPATDIEMFCYYYMFYGCSSLKEIPYLPATKLANRCYNYMFHETNITISNDKPNEYATEYYIPVTKAHLEDLESSYPISQMFGSGNDSSCVDVIKNEKPFYLSRNINVIGKNSLEFISDSEFSISATQKWNGKIEYNIGEGWKEWNGTKITSVAPYHYIYLRGTDNSIITGWSENADIFWTLSGTNIRSNGNIEYLLDYQTVMAGGHPTMDSYCFMSMFKNCAGLVKAPDLPATTLSWACYSYMFYGCTSLEIAPELPATTLIQSCYAHMFRGCANLKTIPYLPATELKPYCYNYMFYDAIKLSITNEGDYTTEYIIPVVKAEVDKLMTAHNKKYPVSQMFVDTQGKFFDVTTVFGEVQTIVYLPSYITIVGAPEI